MKILIAGFGNLLQRDDGFGVVLLRRLQELPGWPQSVRFLDIGIGGITLVQELLEPFDALIVLDAIEGKRPGDIQTLKVSAESGKRHPSSNPTDNDFHHQDRFADIHYAEPGRAIALASEIGSLPNKVFLVGCVPESTDLGDEMSEPVRRALSVASGEVQQLVTLLTNNSKNDFDMAERRDSTRTM